MPTANAAAAETAMDFDAVVRGRRSVRAFRPGPVPDSVLKELIAVATWAPSAVNAQSTTYLVVRDQTLLTRMSLAAQAHVLSHLPAEDAPKQFRELVDDDDFHIFYHAPALVVVAARAASEWAAEDCSLAAENLMLAAYASGLGSCWIGFAQHWLATPEGHAMLGISEDLQPVAPIVVGWPKAWPSAPLRRPARIRWIG